MPSESYPQKDSSKTQAFIDSIGGVKAYELSDFSNLIGATYSVVDSEGIELGTITLDEVTPLPENQTRRRSVRKYPFSLIFSRERTDILASGMYALRPSDSDSEAVYLHLKPLDFEPSENIHLYESVIN